MVGRWEKAHRGTCEGGCGFDGAVAVDERMDGCVVHMESFG